MTGSQQGAGLVKSISGQGNSSWKRPMAGWAWSLKQCREGQCGLAGCRWLQDGVREARRPDGRLGKFGVYSECNRKPHRSDFSLLKFILAAIWNRLKQGAKVEAGETNYEAVRVVQLRNDGGLH